MALNLKKNIVVGVSINPEFGLEVAQIEFETQTVLKYGRKNIEYDNVAKNIADLDTFQETLFELFTELDIPKGSEVVLNLPSTCFNVVDFPASMDEGQVTNAIEETLLEHPIYQNTEASISFTRLPNSTIQMNKFVYAATQKVTLIELAMQIKKMGYKLIGVDSSVNSTLNALAYNQMVDVSSAVSWLLLIVDNSSCKIFSMQGMNYVDNFEERISIGEVLGDAENYATVASAVNPVIKNLPSQRLFVVSNTNIISAQILAEKLIYNAQIVHLDANMFAKKPMMSVSEFITSDEAKRISPEVIGAAINKKFQPYYSAHINLFNKSLGDIWENEQPLVVAGMVLSLENMIVASIVVGILMSLLFIGGLVTLTTLSKTVEEEIKTIDKNISRINSYLEKNKNISAEIFDEGDEIRIGLAHNKNLYSYYSIIGTEIPQKLWLTKVYLGEKTVIAGQADNLESVYGFSRNIKDYNPESKLQLKKLALASDSSMQVVDETGDGIDTEAIVTSLNADYYEFVISDTDSYEKLFEQPSDKDDKKNSNNSSNKTSSKKKSVAPLESIEK